jgi:AraC-like DNA-binding protein
MFGSAFRLQPEHGRRWMLLGGVVSILYVGLPIVAPLTGAVVLTWWLGASPSSLAWRSPSSSSARGRRKAEAAAAGPTAQRPRRAPSDGVLASARGEGKSDAPSPLGGNAMVAVNRTPSAVTPGPDDRVRPAAKPLAVVDAPVAENVPAEAALAGTGLTATALTAPRSRVSVTDTLAVYGNAARLSADPMFAHRVGAGLHVSAYGMYGFAILSSTDFRQTVQFVTAYHLLATPLTTLRLDEADGVAYWTVPPVPHLLVDERLTRFIVEMQFGLHLSLHRDVMGPEFAFEELRVGWHEPGNAESYAAALDCRVRYGQAAHASASPPLSWTGPRHLASGRSAPMSSLSAMHEMGHGLGVVGQVRHLLLVNPTQPMSFADVAREIGMSARTLRRRLAAECKTFRGVLDALRRDLALRHLRDKGRTVEEIAFGLGFSDAANFRHAFRRWTNSVPRRGFKS